jgi:DNA-binding beta-propeller fold protein YncE
MRRHRVLAAVVAAALTAGCNPSSSSFPGRIGPAPRSYPIAGPVGVAVVDSSVWVVSASAGTVTGFDAATGKKLRTVAVGETPLRAASDGKLLWVSVFGAGQVVAVDPTSGRVIRRTGVPGQPEGIVSAFGAIWVVRQQARKLTRIDPSGKLGPSYPLGSEPRLVTASASDLFVADVTDGTITRIDPQSGRRTVSKQVCDGAQNLADQDGKLWVTCTRSDTVVAVDERTLTVTRKLRIKGEPDGIVRSSDGGMLIVTTTGPAVYEVPQGNGQKVQRLAVLGKRGALLDRANDDLAVADGRVWVSDYQGNRVVLTNVTVGA